MPNIFQNVYETVALIFWLQNKQMRQKSLQVAAVFTILAHDTEMYIPQDSCFNYSKEPLVILDRSSEFGLGQMAAFVTPSDRVSNLKALPTKKN